MILETIVGYKSSWRILELLTETPTKPITRKEIRQHTKLGNEAINRTLERFVIADIIIKEKQGKKESCYLNTINPFCKKIIELIKEEKRQSKNIGFENHIILSQFTREVLEKTKFVKKILLFGSVAKGIARVNSDIDLAIITNKKDTKQELIATAIIDEIEQRWKKRIQVHYFTKREFSQCKTTLINEIERDGIDFLGYNKRISE